MRIPFAVNLESRDGTVFKDAKVKNGIIEQRGENDLRVRMRSGLVDLGLVKAGIAQLLYSWNGIKAVLADTLNAFTLATVTTPTQTAFTPTAASQQFSAQDNGSNSTTPLLMLQNGLQAWSVNQAGVVTAITLPAALGTHVVSITSLTRVGTVATAVIATDPLFDVGQSITIAGATPGAYNGAQVVTSVTPSALSPAASIAIMITRVGTTATAVTSDGSPHGLSSGTYTISGAGDAAYNGAFAITVTSITAFTYTVTLSGTGPDNDVPITITRSGTTATATSVSAHGLISGNYVISGATQVEYNGTKAVTVTSVTQFTFTVTVADSPVSPATGSPVMSDWFETCSVNNSGPGGFTVLRVTTTPGNSVTNGQTIIFNATSGIGAIIGSWVAQNRTTSSFEVVIPTLTSAVAGGVSFFRTPVAISSITRSGSTATITTSTPHGIRLGNHFTVGGATQPEYNKTDLGGALAFAVTGASTLTYPVFVTTGAPVSPATGTIIVVGKTPASPATGAPVITNPEIRIPASFTFTIGGSPVTPATGTITGTYSKRLVPGIAYLDGTFYVMDETGVIYNTTPAGDDPTTFPALGFIPAQNENGGGVACNKSASYVVAFKEWSSEFFYNTQSTTNTNTPLGPVPNGFTQIGCASGDSLKDLDGTLFWISQARKGGRGVHMMTGLDQQKISTPDIDRILKGDDLITVYAYAFKLHGHSVYLLTLVSSNISLLYDLTSQTWTEVSSYTVASTPSVTSITLSGGIATVVTALAHGLSDGDPVLISGASPSWYSGIHQIQYVSTTSFSYKPAISIAGETISGSIIFGKLTESYFKFTQHLNYNGQDLFLHESDGHLYLMDPGQRTDAGLPVNLFTRTQRLDGGVTDRKKMAALRVIGDALNGIAMVRFSDDDCATFTPYRVVDLDDERSEIRKCGAFRRRTIETRYISGRYLAETSPNLAALELEIK